MATVEQRHDRFRLIFYFRGRRYAASLKTTKRQEADDAAGAVERTLQLIEQRLIAIPDGADFVTFVLSGGRLSDEPRPPSVRTLAELKGAYLQAHGLGAMEKNSLDTITTHLAHVVETLGAQFPVQSLELSHLQQHVERRARQRGFFRRPLSAVTLRKEVASFRACWNWGAEAGLVHGRFPGRGLRYPKTAEKPPFQTWEEIQRQVARGGLSEVEQKELWDCLYLTLPQVEEFLDFARANARHGFLYPMVVTAAHTGVRRGELLAARVDDVDFAGGTVVVREKKRVRGQRSFRRVPLSPALERVLRAWVAGHPGGQHLFCHRLAVPRSKKRRAECGPLTRNEANDHFRRLVAGSRWAVLRGWHVLRHSFVSNCASRGVDQRMIDEWAGHQTEAMRKRYRHLVPSQQRQALRSVFGEGE
jgi:integrase